MRKVFTISFFISFYLCSGQVHVDSLKQLLLNKTINEQYIDVLNELSFQLLLQKPSDALPYINDAISIAGSLNYDKGYFRAMTNKGSAYWSSGLPDLALKYYVIAKASMVEGNWVLNASLMNNIGEVFKKKGQYDSAIKYYREGIAEAKKGRPIRLPVMLYYNLGEAFLVQNKADSAEKYFHLTFDSAKITNHKRGLAYSYSGIAELDKRKRNYASAISNQQHALLIRKNIADTRGVIQSYHQLSANFDLNGNPKIAKRYLDSAALLASANKTFDLLSETYDLIAGYHTKNKEYEEALSYATMHYELNDSLSNHVFVENLDQVKAALMSEIQLIENKLLVENQQKLESDTQLKLTMILGVSSLVIMLGVFLYLNQQRKNAIRTTANNRSIIETLQKVSYSGSSRDFHQFMKELLETSADTLKAERVSFWSYNEDDKTIEISDFFSKYGKFETLGTKATIGFYKDYFELLKKETILAVTDTNSSELTVEYDKDYIKKFGIKSLLDVEIRSEDAFIGILSFEQTSGKRRWSYSDQRFAASLSNIISSAYLLDVNRLLLNQLLDKNKQLLDSGFALSHYLREPLSQILGFSAIMLKDKQLENKEIWKFVDEASKRMDEVIKRLTIQLAQEDKKN